MGKANIIYLNGVDLLSIPSKEAQLIVNHYDCKGKFNDLGKRIAKKFSYTESFSEKNKPGSILVKGNPKNKERFVVAFFIENDKGEKNLEERIDNFNTCLERLNKKCKKIKSIAFPSDIGGEESDKFLKLIKKWGNDHSDTKIIIVSEEESEEESDFADDFEEEEKVSEKKDESESESEEEESEEEVVPEKDKKVESESESEEEESEEEVVPENQKDKKVESESEDESEEEEVVPEKKNQKDKKVESESEDEEEVVPEKKDEQEKTSESQKAVSDEEILENVVQKSVDIQQPKPLSMTTLCNRTLFERKYRDVVNKDPRYFSMIVEVLLDCPGINLDYIMSQASSKIKMLDEFIKLSQTDLSNMVTITSKSKEESSKKKDLMEEILPSEEWRELFESQKEELEILFKQIYKNKKVNVYPPRNEIFNAFKYCKPQDIKVVILGQDPYHTPGAAMGLAFSHHPNKGTLQPSLKNIFKELKDDGYKPNKTGDLTKWAKQGVFLINTSLTVEEGKPNSHQGIWNDSCFVDQVLRYLSRTCKNLIVIAWGKNAQNSATMFRTPPHEVLKSTHPSPFSADKGFLGSRPFSTTNKMLKKMKIEPIDWNL